MADLFELFGQEPEQLLELPPEELAGFLLEHLHSSFDDEGKELLGRERIIRLFGEPLAQSDRYDLIDPIAEALAEAWWWLEREGLVLPRPDNPDYFFVTRRGNQLRQATDLDEFRKRRQLPRQILHPLIESKVWPPFLRGDYDAAVFQAFREVEIAVTDACGFTDNPVGDTLMARAFNEDPGPLTDTSEVEPERRGLRFLFQGGIGRFRNSTAHRVVGISDPGEAIEIICFASWLLKLVDERK